MQYDAKNEYLQSEGDNYFECNLKKNEHEKATIGTQIFYEFIHKQCEGGGGDIFQRGKE